MKTVTLTGHFDGKQIQLDEPYDIPSEARVLVTVLPAVDEDAQAEEWSQMARSAHEKWSEENPY